MGDRLATIDMGQNWGEVLCPLFGGRAGSLPNAYLCTKWHLNPSSHLATTYMGGKLGRGSAPIGEGELGPHLTQCGMGHGLPPSQVSS